MKIYICTISFRHHLLSLEELVRWAAATGFDGIELWGAHARNLVQDHRDARWLAEHGLEVPMISDYLPLDDPLQLEAHALHLVRAATRWGAGKVRTFAGRTSDKEISSEARKAIVAGLSRAARIFDNEGLSLLVETHPGTLADSLDATRALVAEVDHPALGVNFDAIHLWEAGDDPLEAHRLLAPRIRHHHLKNVARRSDLPVFAPENIYNAAGCRRGIVPLMEGAYDYRPLLGTLARDQECPVSLEWFGRDPFHVLAEDCRRLREITGPATQTEPSHHSLRQQA